MKIKFECTDDGGDCTTKACPLIGCVEAEEEEEEETDDEDTEQEQSEETEQEESDESEEEEDVAQFLTTEYFPEPKNSYSHDCGQAETIQIWSTDKEIYFSWDNADQDINCEGTACSVEAVTNQNE